MRTKLEQVLERCLNGREVSVWGNPSRRLLRELEPFKFSIAGAVDPQKHYVVIVSEDDLTDFKSDEQSKPFTYANDYVVFNDIGCELPFEWECYGVKIGRQTYFSEWVAEACEEGLIEQIGHFTSINNSAKITVDHQLNMTFVSDEIKQFFNDENKAKCKDIHLADPKHPYGLNKKRITIGNDVWFGAFSFINASRVESIGDGAIIATSAVVLEDVPPYAIMVGAPAKILRYRYEPEMIETLLRVKWWNWSEAEINANADALMSPEIFQKRFGI